jgi:hypothetical protein
MPTSVRQRAVRGLNRILLGRLGADRCVGLSDRLNLLALGPLAGFVPLHYTTSLARQAHDLDVRRHVEGVVASLPASVEHYEFPPELPMWFRRSKAFDVESVYRLRDVAVSPRTGLTWLPDVPLLIEESYGDLVRALGWGDVRSELLLPIRHIAEGGPLVQFAPHGYFHWLLEVVPAALAALSVEPSARLLLPYEAPRYAKEAAEELVGRQRIVRAHGPVRGVSVVMASIAPESGFVRREAIERLRAAFPVSPGEDGVIYISRRQDTTRGLANEGDVESALRKAGARVVYAQDLSFADQRRLFAGAELIVAPHGGGLANIVWARSNARVIEVFPAEGLYFNDCYARMATTLGLEYTYMTASPAERGSGRVDTDALLELAGL